MMKKLMLFAAMIAAATFSAHTVAADDADFPTKPIELLVPSAPGAPSDVAVRAIARRWGEILGKPIIIINKPGAGGAIAARQVATANPDGYTLLTGYDSVIVALPVTTKPGYDVDSFTYIGGYAAGPIYLMVDANSPWKDIKGFIESAKVATPPLAYASYGVGVITHFTAERLWELAGVKLNYIPFKSSPETAQALLGGVVPLVLTAGTGGMGSNPKVRMIAVAGDERRAQYPNVPTLKEAGFNVSLDYLAGIMGPKGLSAVVERKLASTFARAMKEYEEEIRQNISRAEMSYLLLDGKGLHQKFKDRATWFTQMAPRMNLNK